MWFAIQDVKIAVCNLIQHTLDWPRLVVYCR